MYYTRMICEDLKAMQNKEMAKPGLRRTETYDEVGLQPSTKLCALSNLHTGADEGTRTHDLCFTKALLYQLSYIGKFAATNPDTVAKKRRSLKGRRFLKA